jgi:hypothetical protein
MPDDEPRVDKSEFKNTFGYEQFDRPVQFQAVPCLGAIPDLIGDGRVVDAAKVFIFYPSEQLADLIIFVHWVRLGPHCGP